MCKILIVGTGALATLFAARLGQADLDVLMLGAWPQAVEALNQRGARLVTAQGPEVQSNVRAANTPSDCGEIGLALVLVKAWQTPTAAQALSACLPPAALVVTFQNGLGNRETLVNALGEKRVLAGVCTYGARLLAPGLVRCGGEGVLSLEAHPRSGEASALLRRAGFRVEIVPDGNSLLWGKLVINAAINPLTALLRLPNGALLEQPSTRRLMAALARESAEVARACGARLPFDDPVAAVEAVAQNTAQNRSSMLQDVERGAQTEIDAISGAVARTATAQGLEAPLNWVMWQLVSALHGK